MSAIRRHFSYANVIATTALFVALGGTSYAAVTLSKGSVKSRHLASNAVTSAKVKDGSLSARDFKAGQLPAGRDGAAGAQGPTGVAGERGGDGASGPAGAPGAAGARGEQGPAGERGPAGPQGDDGVLATAHTPASSTGVPFTTVGAWAGVTPAAGQPEHRIAVTEPARLLITATVDVAKLANQADKAARFDCGVQIGSIGGPFEPGGVTRQVTLEKTDGDSVGRQFTIVEQFAVPAGTHRAQITCFNETPNTAVMTRAGTITTIAVPQG